MRVVVPFDAVDPKTRLAPVLSSPERAAFARAMLADVLVAVGAAGGDPELLATAPVDPSDELDADVDPDVRVDERPLSVAVNAALDDGRPAAVVMADLALATPAAIARVLSAGGDGDGDVVLVPGRGGGTNAVAVSHPEFAVDYHGVSIRDHREAAAAVGTAVTTVDSFRLSTDVDDPADLVEVLLHGDGRARAWLVEAGFAVTTDDRDRVALARDGEIWDGM